MDAKMGLMMSDVGDQRNLSLDDPGISAENFDALPEQAHISNLLASRNNS